LSTKTDELEWRRSKVVEMRARESIKEYTTEHLPKTYQVCLCALDTIFIQYSNIKNR